MSEPLERERRTVFYTGHVQGVGFRWTAVRVASGFAVVGTVRNLSDGRVELIAEGPASELDRFLGAVEEAMRPNIWETCSSTSPGTGEFAWFSVRH